jgi:peptidoglycan/LPS O-acetylase OafA/YrhL
MAKMASAWAHSARGESPPTSEHPADTSQPGRGGRAHFPCFDGLRAIAACAVLLHHAGFATGYSVTGRFGAYLAHGDSGVAVFFLISGFLLYRPFVVAHLDGRTPTAADRFLWRRALRIIPGYWVALVGIYVIFGFGQGTLHSFSDFFAYFGLAQIYDTTRFFHGVNQAWSLATEISFYLFLPLYAWIIRRVAARRTERRVRVEVFGLVLLVVICVVWRLAWFSYDPFWHRYLAHRHSTSTAPFSALATQYWLPTHFDLFALGMGLAVLSAWVARRGSAPRLVARVGQRPALCWTLAAVTYWVVCTRVGLPRTLVPLTGTQLFVRQALYGLTAGFLLLPAIFGGQRQGLVRRFLCWGPVAYVGLVSYGIYLWHQAWIGQVREDWLGQPVLFHGPIVPVIVIAFTFTMLTATASYYVVERPALRLKDQPPWRRPRPVHVAVASGSQPGSET